MLYPMERKSISDVLELALESATDEYQAQSATGEHVSTDESDDANSEEQPNRKRKRETLINLTSRTSTDEDPTIPACPICLQPYSHRSYLRPCYHSFCIDCIRQWFNIGKVCPMCKQHVTSIVYNIGERSGTFLEYNFDGLPHIPEAIYEQAVRNAASQTSSSETAGQRALTHRRRIYHDSMIPDPGYPPASRRHFNTTHILPYHIAKVSTSSQLKVA
jgi:hypothetical protein